MIKTKSYRLEKSKKKFGIIITRGIHGKWTMIYDEGFELTVN